jgi:hypothetical protein
MGNKQTMDFGRPLEPDLGAEPCFCLPSNPILGHQTERQPVGIRRGRQF